MHVFVYGSLMDPGSLARTLPGVETRDCVPARLAGHERAFDVGFPNDGSQPDKSYVAGDGSRPALVLFANLRPAGPGSSVNGVLVPASPEALGRLRGRELRYRVVDVTGQVQAYPGWPEPADVVGFAGRPRFVAAARTGGGLVPADYLRSIEDGAWSWERRCPGFLADFASSTRAPAPGRVADLRRIDA